MAENATDTLISNLIVEDLNLKEEQFEIIRESSSLDGSAVCTVRYGGRMEYECDVIVCANTLGTPVMAEGCPVRG